MLINTKQQKEEIVLLSNISNLIKILTWKSIFINDLLSPAARADSRQGTRQRSENKNVNRQNRRIGINLRKKTTVLSLVPILFCIFV